MAGTNLPSDPVQLEKAIVMAIRDVFLSVPLIQQYAMVEMRERFPDTDGDDELISTVPDPVQSSLRFTSLIQIGLPTVEEFERTSDKHTQLNFTYPITFDMAVKDIWDDDTLEYQNSRDLFMAIYLKARSAFKGDPSDDNSRDFGYNNCVHQYLQQESVGTVEDEESGSRLHVADWSLTVNCTGVLI